MFGWQVGVGKPLAGNTRWGRIRFSGAAIILLASAFQLASTPVVACDIAASQKATVADVTDGDTLRLTDGTLVRLIGAKAPTVPLGYSGAKPWPLVDEAKQALSELAAGAEVELRFGGTRTDRHGNSLAQVFVVKDGNRIWLQSELVKRGLARVYSFPDNRACVAELLANEDEARTKHLGVWAVSAYSVLRADDVERLGKLTRSYQLVEGVVAAVGEGGSRIYLNFAKDWKSDFTVSIDRKDAAAFKDGSVDPKDLSGKRIRVRGWLEWRNGPMIEVTHLEQIELLPGGDGTAPTGQAPVPTTLPPDAISL